MKIVRFLGKLLLAVVVVAGIALAFVYWRSSTLLEPSFCADRRYIMLSAH